jgi:hypothetical protein
MEEKIKQSKRVTPLEIAQFTSALNIDKYITIRMDLYDIIEFAAKEKGVATKNNVIWSAAAILGEIIFYHRPKLNDRTGIEEIRTTPNKSGEYWAYIVADIIYKKYRLSEKNITSGNTLLKNLQFVTIRRFAPQGSKKIYNNYRLEISSISYYLKVIEKIQNENYKRILHRRNYKKRNTRINKILKKLRRKKLTRKIKINCSFPVKLNFAPYGTPKKLSKSLDYINDTQKVTLNDVTKKVSLINDTQTVTQNIYSEYLNSDILIDEEELLNKSSLKASIHNDEFIELLSLFKEKFPQFGNIDSVADLLKGYYTNYGLDYMTLVANRLCQNNPKTFNYIVTTMAYYATKDLCSAELLNKFYNKSISESVEKYDDVVETSKARASKAKVAASIDATKSKDELYINSIDSKTWGGPNSISREEMITAMKARADVSS